MLSPANAAVASSSAADTPNPRRMPDNLPETHRISGKCDALPGASCQQNVKTRGSDLLFESDLFLYRVRKFAQYFFMNPQDRHNFLKLALNSFESLAVFFTMCLEIR